MALSMPPIGAPGRQPLRARLLGVVFELLYGPFSWLHEAAGRAIFGRAWAARRMLVIDYCPPGATILDLGCGDGRLLLALRARGAVAVGIDPSPNVVRRAHRRGVSVAVAAAEHQPFREGTFGAVVCTYPGPWIATPAVWKEIARVATAGAPVIVLLGGDYRRGPFVRARQIAIRIAYGRTEDDGPATAAAKLGDERVRGAIARHDDAWGSAYVWVGERR